MNKPELITEIAGKAGITKKDAEAALQAFIDTVTETLEVGQIVKLLGFGSFETNKRAAREGRNPSTGEKIIIPATTVPKFKPGKDLKDRVAK